MILVHSAPSSGAVRALPSQVWPWALGAHPTDSMTQRTAPASKLVVADSMDSKSLPHFFPFKKGQKTYKRTPKIIPTPRDVGIVLLLHDPYILSLDDSSLAISPLTMRP